VDDLNIDLGKIRIRSKGKDGGHNGLKSIDQHLGGNNYSRMRLGIGNDFHSGQQVNFVLGEWTEEEQSTKSTMVKNAQEALLSFCFAGINNTMNTFNN
jgi:PTH1 family peptidyl-tRNA hydrolase